MQRIPKQQYTAEFKAQAVRHAQAVGIDAAARELGVVEQTLRNWLKAAQAGKHGAAASQPVAAEQMELSRLRAESARLRLHLDILKKRRRTSPRMRCEVRSGIEAQRRHYPLKAMCEALGVSISGYRAWSRGGSPKRCRLSDAQALALIRAIHAEFAGAYGSRRIHRELQARVVAIGLRRVERLMHEHGIRARHKRRYKATTDSAHALTVAAGWRATSRCASPTRSGRATSPTSPRPRADCTWPSCRTCSTARSWTGRSSRTSRPIWSPMH